MFLKNIVTFILLGMSVGSSVVSADTISFSSNELIANAYFYNTLYDPPTSTYVYTKTPPAEVNIGYGSVSAMATLNTVESYVNAVPGFSA